MTGVCLFLIIKVIILAASFKKKSRKRVVSDSFFLKNPLIGRCPILIDCALSELLKVKTHFSKHQRPGRALSIRIGQRPINYQRV